ncbi:DUF6221 family protein [Streptomyces scabiei]|uniref:DUF6221 family protein n=1 Tax=Streptomyces scabiei TaxID=1930 RepID=UPI0029AE33BF|nr:DUF6221 family protein [Streptomyces scabiei]MDX3520704.1 DUF6221 family protein [Streptomyces scabiei]
MDLHAWITQQVDEVEARAKAATQGPWEGVVDHHQRGVVDASVWSDTLGHYITEKISSGERHEADAHHIGANSPDVVLRRCETDRRILARHTLDPDVTYEPACKGCGTYGDYGLSNVDNLNDCPELLDLAHAHGLTDETLGGLDRPQPPEPTPAQKRRLRERARLTVPITTSDVPEALRGPRWKP